MLDRPPREPRMVSWLLVILWALAIYVTIFFGRAIQSYVTGRWGAGAFVLIVGASLLVGLLFAVGWMMRRDARSTALAWFILIVIVFAYAAGTYHLRHNPEEAVHFVEYGVLGLLVYRALTHTVRDRSIFLTAAVITACFGAVDECIQWLVPRRYFDYRDIWINVIGSSLMLAALAFGIAFTAILLTFFSNTAQVQDRYLRWSIIPDFMKTDREVMTEYGYRYRTDDRIAFSSRISRDELADLDRAKGAEYGAILNQYQGDHGFHLIQPVYGHWNEPLLYEVRVRLFRRDRHIADALRSVGDDAAARRHATIAWREQDILERFTPVTYEAATGYGLSPVARDMLRRAADLDSWYVSDVARHLVTSFRQWQITTALGLVIVVCFLAERRLARKEHDHVDPT